MVYQTVEFYAKIERVSNNLNISKETQIKKVKKIFEHVSIETFIKYFYQFQSNKGIRSNSIILDAFKSNNESWSKNSSATRASKGKSIFEQELEIIAIHYITEFANENKLSEATFKKANEIKAKLYKSNNSVNYEVKKNSDNSKLMDNINEIELSHSLIESEKEVLIKYRIGQSTYRSKLIEYWNGCSVSDCKVLEVLISSHIKPYRDCENLEEKFDLYNGLLLSPNYDRLFDKYLISFRENGQILISNTLCIDELNKLGIKKNDTLKTDKLTNQHIKYLRHHNTKFFELQNSSY